MAPPFPDGAALGSGSDARNVIILEGSLCGSWVTCGMMAQVVEACILHRTQRPTDCEPHSLMALSLTNSATPPACQCTSCTISADEKSWILAQVDHADSSHPGMLKMVLINVTHSGGQISLTQMDENRGAQMGCKRAHNSGDVTAYAQTAPSTLDIDTLYANGYADQCAWQLDSGDDGYGAFNVKYIIV